MKRDAAVELFVHIPGLSLEPDLQYDHANGVLRVLTYDHWARLDPEVAVKRRRVFEAARPSVYVRTAAIAIETNFSKDRNVVEEPEETLARYIAGFDDINRATDPALRAAVETANELALAMTLLSGAALPPIAESMTYASDGRWVSRTAGRLERRALLEPPVFTFRKDNAGQLDRLLALFDAARPALRIGEFSQAASALSAVSLPDFEPIDGLMHVTIAIEALLLADVTVGVTSAFSERGAALLANDISEVPALRSKLEAVYSVRSDALHGRDISHSMTSSRERVDLLYSWTRRALGQALIRVLHVCRNTQSPFEPLENLRAELDAVRIRPVIPQSLLDAPPVFGL